MAWWTRARRGRLAVLRGPAGAFGAAGPELVEGAEDGGVEAPRDGRPRGLLLSHCREFVKYGEDGCGKVAGRRRWFLCLFLQEQIKGKTLGGWPMLRYPQGVAVDRNGFIFVRDTTNDRIAVLDASPQAPMGGYVGAMAPVNAIGTQNMDYESALIDTDCSWLAQNMRPLCVFRPLCCQPSAFS